MPELDFAISGVETPDFAAQPMLIFKLSIANREPQTPIHSVILHSQIHLAVTRRRYSATEQERLLEIFGEPQRWRETLRDRLWTHVNVFVPQFIDAVTVDLPVYCTYDFEVASTKYFDALEDGEIPLNFLFSGTLFYEGEAENLQVGRIPWQKEAAYRLPVVVWRAMIQRYYPNSAWVRLQKDVFDRLSRYKIQRGLPTWDKVVAELLEREGHS
jgi:hypothetical protein